ncbi:hypothetical protein RHMOL_Rhmol05G0038600 [Rhododendron molle]|uniref:Uncharacterized protein n=1 Tax=Rhododendron molle TaxID=49168 RepID=A0ACC0NMC2_RHOML|nr:hypothetical protein RHMOL_Rhmol05G0038600 [Rhododendron molle]
MSIGDEAIVITNAPEEGTQGVEESSTNQPPLKGKKLSWNKLRRYDSLDIESNKFNGHQAAGWSVVFQLAFQSIGVVYGDIGTSPLYVYSSTFTEGIKHNDDILGVLSLIIYTITLIPLIKYVFIVLRANDNGDGGTFALYSLLCRYAKVGLTPSQQAEDGDISNFRLELPNNRLKRASWVKSSLEKSRFAKYFLLFAAMLGTSMVIGDGVLTPSISVLSAVSGLQEATSSITQGYSHHSVYVPGKIVWISVAILVLLFSVQRFGTDKVGYSFAPVISIWFLMIAGIGVYNFIKFDPTVIKALNPKYIVDYFQRNKKEAWISLGGVVLAITGTEAMFADLGHFSVKSIQISMCAMTYPALMLAYIGQAAFLRKNNDLVSNTFYKSIPHGVYWPMFVVAVLAAIIASQAMISGAFSIIQQSLALGCFSQGEGIAVVFVMTLTSAFLILVMIMIWKTSIHLMILYILIVGSVEILYLSSVLYKCDQGGYLPLGFAAFLMVIMFIWNDVYRRKYYYELDHKVSPTKVKEIIDNGNLCRVPGLAIFYSELVHGIPPIFKHYAENVPALHSVLVFVSIKSLPISKVPMEERFLFRRVQPNELNIFRCVVRYGYTDSHNEQEPFERILVGKLKEIIRDDCRYSAVVQNVEEKNNREELDNESANSECVNIEGEKVNNERQIEAVEREIEVLNKAWHAGVVHLMGENEVIAGQGANIGKKVVIDYAYNFIRRNLRQTEKDFDIPHQRLLKVGMIYEL